MSLYLAIKQATASPQTSYGLAGRLYLSRSNWLLLSVPNALVRGLFDALDEPGVELPLNSAGLLNAHISVMRPDELESVGGSDKITERGRLFHYTFGKLKTVEPRGWTEMSRCWMTEVRSPELEALRKSYGLSRVPNDGKFEFHITVAVRRKRVLQANPVSKAACLKLVQTVELLQSRLGNMLGSNLTSC